MGDKTEKTKKIKKKMTRKKKFLVIVAVVLSVLALLAVAGIIAVYSYINSTASGPSPAGKHYSGEPIKKSETVYVDTDTEGRPGSVVVDAYLRNNPEKKDIVDKTTLNDIVNINGNEEYSENKDGTITWPANGSDIYYEGIGKTEDVPVEMEVKYYLDGKRISGEKLEGKSGKLKIRIKYKNNKYVNINGKNVQVPLVVMTALVVNDKSLSKIKINNGKVINSSGVKVAVGISAPGLLEEGKISALSEAMGGELVIQGVAKKFKGNEIISMVSTDVLKYVTNKNLNKLNLDKKITKLDSSTKQIVAGSQKISRAIKLFRTGSRELKEGTGAVKDASVKLADGTKQVITELGEATDKLGEMAQVINNAILYIDDDVNGDDGLVVKSGDLVTKTAAIYAAMNAPEISGTMNSVEIGKMENAIDNSTLSPGDKAQMRGYLSIMRLLVDQDSGMGKIAVESKEISDESNVIGKVLKGQQASDNTNPELEKKLQELEHWEEMRQEDGSYMGLVDFSTLWVEKNAEMSKALQDILTDDNSVVVGSKKLAAGIRKVDSGTAKLNTSVDKLEKGYSKLDNGITKYYNQGIKKIVDMYNDQLSGVVKNLRIMKAAGEKYNNYSGITDEMDGSVTFMYFTPMGDW